MTVITALLAALAYFELKDYRQARRTKRMQSSFSQMARRVDSMRADLNKYAEIPDRVGILAEGLNGMRAQLDDIQGKSEILVKEYETVLQYRKQGANMSADFYEG